ncbi:hypothetical protein RB195_013085 [Necator americanus]|uniref:Core-2/I-Branching enzyme n=1 Tax=Necator americanus TaxID=51031 RepID=A0ABR1DTX6_NECAM
MDVMSLGKDCISEKLFNPFRFFGNANMWPKGFPLKYVQTHTNGQDRYCLCRKMRTAVVQHGLIHNDPDVDPIFRLLHAEKKTSTDEEFNVMAPTVVLGKGTYSPWNSQNTLFSRRAFFTLYLPITAPSSWVADLIRSYFAQKLLHMIDENVAFYPPNVRRTTKSHDLLAEFEGQRDAFLKSEEIIKFLDSWECIHKEISTCTVLLAVEFSKKGFWGSADAEMIRKWIDHLRSIGYQFPRKSNHIKYIPREDIRGANCRRANVEFEADGFDEQKSADKLRMFANIDDWCTKTGENYTEFRQKFPSPSKLTLLHANNVVLRNLRKSVLVITNNYPWNHTIGLLQRLYQPFFALTIFCGSWFPEKYHNG